MSLGFQAIGNLTLRSDVRGRIGDLWIPYWTHMANKAKGKLYTAIKPIIFWADEEVDPNISLLRLDVLGDVILLHCGYWKGSGGAEYILLLIGERVYRTWLTFPAMDTYLKEIEKVGLTLTVPAK